MGQPKDYPTGHSITYGNGRINSLLNTVNALTVILLAAMMIWTVTTLHTLTTQVAVLISQNETRVNDYARLDSRITDIERERWTSNSNDDRK